MTRSTDTADKRMEFYIWVCRNLNESMILFPPGLHCVHLFWKVVISQIQYYGAELMSLPLERRGYNCLQDGSQNREKYTRHPCSYLEVVISQIQYYGSRTHVFAFGKTSILLSPGWITKSREIYSTSM